MIFERSERFKKAYRDLPELLKKKVNKSLLFFEQNPRHPSLHVEKIDFEEDIWSGRVDRGYRFTFQWVPGGIYLRNIGSHQQAYRHP